ncbi:hypothetical protein GE061_007399 [Apolygus lucorum]|uniref:Cystatin domain-containing protein n=1 Tax=Apolygus lucorum TaxID=248454 RepID=A0A6A4J6M3_APOLU|nr:hypothetical protein GE061_007399 [Apolygus lucorum]
MLIPLLTVVLALSALMNTTYCDVAYRPLSAVDKKLLIQEMANAGAPGIDRFIQGTVDVEKNKVATYHFDYINYDTGRECHGVYRKFRSVDTTKIKSQRTWKCDD